MEGRADGLVGHLDRTDTVHIATRRRDGGEVVTPIWAVVADGVPYIRSGYGPDSLWYRRALRTGSVAFADGDARYPATLQRVEDEATLAAVDRAYEAKYASYAAPLRQMVSPEARPDTLRVTPAAGPS
jgi:hypothetical protein